MYGLKISETEIGKSPIYSVGETISLMLQVDGFNIDTIGDTVDVDITDIYGNAITTIVANRVNDIYVAEWTIPLEIHSLYNVLGVIPDISPSSLFYYLNDNWILPDGNLSFEMLVERRIDQPVIDNSLYEISIGDIFADDNTILNPVNISFYSNLSPYYCTSEDVRSVYREEMTSISDTDIIRDIIYASKQVDTHMKPDAIFRLDQYELAVRMYCKYYVARQHLSFLLNINAESKEIDMLKYSRNSNDPVRIIEGLDALIQKYAYIIWAGGKDTPFIPKTFTKGIFDPNRTQANRLGLDTSDPYPWVNTSTENSVFTDKTGQTIEVRGTRTVTFLRNRTSSPNVYLRSEGLS